MQGYILSNIKMIQYFIVYRNICACFQLNLNKQPNVMALKGQHKQNIHCLDLAQNKNIQFHDQQARQASILFQYKMLQIYGPLLGIYAIPNLENYMIWNCIIFVRKGFFKDGKFKFNVHFSEGFPKSCPKIIFSSQVFHPLVNQNSGDVDIENLLGSKWKYMQENMLYNIFSGLQKMFNQKAKMQIQNSYNPAAGKLLSSKPHRFIEKALGCVDNSLDNLYVNEPGTSLIFNKYENGELEKYQRKLSELCETSRPPEEKRKQFLTQVMKE